MAVCASAVIPFTLIQSATARPTAAASPGLSSPAGPGESIALVKSSTTSTVFAVGQAVPYTFVVTNTGTVDFHSVSVADYAGATASGPALTLPSCPTNDLAAGASETCTSTYIVTSSDMSSTAVVDTAVASGGQCSCAEVTSPPSTVTIPITPSTPIQTANLTLAKASTTKVISTVGQLIPFTFVVTNHGSQPVSAVAIRDTQSPPSLNAQMSSIVCPSPTLAVGASETCSSTYTVSFADFAHGSVTDTAVAVAVPDGGVLEMSGPSTVTIPIETIAIVKTSSTTAITAVGQVVPYTFVVTNTSAIPLQAVSVTDFVGATTGGATRTRPHCPTTNLAAGASETCTSTYTVTSADMASPAVVDTAVAHGSGCGCATITSDPSTVSIPVGSQQPLTLKKSTSTTTVTAVGQKIAYTFTVTNTSNQLMTNIAVIDTQSDPVLASSLSAISCPSTTLPAGASETCTAVYTTSATDLANGYVSDSAVVTATFTKSPGGSTSTVVTSVPSSVTIPVPSSARRSPIVTTPVSVTG